MSWQQQRLRDAAALLGLTQREIAKQMGVPWPTFEKWLAPTESKSFRAMPAMAGRFVNTIVENHVLKQRLQVLRYPPLGGIVGDTRPSRDNAMTTQKLKLTARDHENMDAFLGYVLDDYKAGEITKDEAVGALAHVMAALDLGNTGEAANWFEQGRKFVRLNR